MFIKCGSLLFVIRLCVAQLVERRLWIRDHTMTEQPVHPPWIHYRLTLMLRVRLSSQRLLHLLHVSFYYLLHAQLLRIDKSILPKVRTRPRERAFGLVYAHHELICGLRGLCGAFLLKAFFLFYRI